MIKRLYITISDPLIEKKKTQNIANGIGHENFLLPLHTPPSRHNSKEQIDDNGVKDYEIHG